MSNRRDEYGEVPVHGGGDLNRREFLKKSSLAAALGAAAASFGLPGLARAAELKVNGLPAVALGRTGLKVTRIAFGGILITEPPVLMRVIDQGINFIHTAPGYQNGRSQEAFGKVFKANPSLRGKVVLALKAMPGEELDEALKVLNTDHADILVPPLESLELIANPQVPELFAKAKQEGKARFMGFACHSNMTEVLNRARELGWYDATLMSYADAQSPAFIEAAKQAAAAGVGIFTMKGLPKRGVDGSDPQVAAEAASRCSAMLGKEHAHSVLASMGSFQSVDFYRDILATKLGSLDTGAEERYWAQQEGRYCAMCGTCAGLCPEAQSIPKLVRFRMYHQDYGMTDYARTEYARLLREEGLPSREVVARAENLCRRSLPLGKMIEEATRILA